MTLAQVGENKNKNENENDHTHTDNNTHHNKESYNKLSKFKLHKIKRLMIYLDHHDKRISNKIHKMEVHSKLENVIYLFARLFNPDFIMAYFALIFSHSILVTNNRNFILKPIIHTCISLILTLLMKKATGRLRPTSQENIKRKYDLRKHEKNCSMPSGDSLQCANFSIILLVYFNTYLGFILIPFVMFSRIFYFCHYVLDTIVGSALGLGISYWLYLLLN
jgi:hypothetical protein